MELSVDLNADLGEGAGHDDELLALISSANIACGVHAGDAEMMRAAMLAARKNGITIGAHPGFDDRENFGRREMKLSEEELFTLVFSQVNSFQEAGYSLGMKPRHVKPHGALYNMAARDQEMADVVARAIQAVDPKLILFAPSASALARAAESYELSIACEVFADRNYLPDGSLVPRTHPQALLHDPEEAADRVVRMLRDGKVRAIDGTDVDVRADTICVHGDTPDAVTFALALRKCLSQEGVVIAPPDSPK